MDATLEKHIVATDGKEMVLIPEGEFRMGSESGYHEERPVHLVRVKSFHMDRNLVTNREYKAYCDAAGAPYPDNPRWDGYPDYFVDYPDYPVVNVSWRQAMDYAEWAGKRLPTEEEWEYAACGGLASPAYPWGDAAPDGSRANFADRHTDYPWREFRTSSGYACTSPVGSFPPNGFGLHDMAGNVFQWTEDWFFAYDDTVHDTERFKDGWGGSKVCRGGCYHSSAADLRVARRRQVLGGGPNMAVGFRCVKDVSGAHKPAVSFEIGHLDTSWHKTLDQARATLDPAMQLCVGTGKLTLDQARRLHNIGFTSVEQYVTWETIENKGEGQWDFSAWDEQVAILKQAGLKWVPFLIAGPAYAMPDWYRASTDFEGLRCLEHNIETVIHSFWAPRWRACVERYIARFAGHYRDSGVVQWPLLGITGDFGEAIMPVWHGNWPTQIAGLYHSHGGYWCADRFAQADFRDKMARKFGAIAALNTAWGTNFSSFGAVALPELAVDPIEGFRVDEYTNPGVFPIRSAADRRRWLDFMDWYRASMTDYAEFWMRLVSRYFPGTPVYLCTGGRAEMWQASEFSQQCKIAAAAGGGVRITNEASNYAANFLVTNWVSSASRFYGGQFSFEPAGQVTEKGIVCRIFNATATGANELHFYEGNVTDLPHKPGLLMKNLAHLYRSQPVKDIGVLYPDVPMMFDDITWDEVTKSFTLLRDYTDFAFIDDTTIADGILKTVKVVIVCGGSLWRRATLEALEAWVNAGGILVGYNFADLRSAETDEPYLGRLFNTAGGERRLGTGASLYVQVSLRDAQIERTGAHQAGNYQADVGSAEAYQAPLFDVITGFLARNGLHLSDGVIDGVFTAQLSDRILVLNTHLEPQEKKIILPDGSSRTMALEANSITEVALV